MCSSDLGEILPIIFLLLWGSIRLPAKTYGFLNIAYTTENYAYHAGLMIYTLQLMNRTNQMSDIVVNDAEVVDMLDSPDDSQDTVTIGFSASAKDSLVDNATNQTLFTDNSMFTEYWRFRRHGKDWLLDGVDQATANPAMYNPQIDQFARHSENGANITVQPNDKSAAVSVGENQNHALPQQADPSDPASPSVVKVKIGRAHV